METLNAIQLALVVSSVILISPYISALDKVNAEVRRDNSVVDDYFGTKVPDPYRWLEDLNSAETRSFVELQKRIANDYFNNLTLSPGRQPERIKLRVKELWNFTRKTAPQRTGCNYYHMENSGLEDFDILYVRKNLKDEPRVFFDPNKLSTDGSIALAHHVFSPDGQFFAYSIMENGSDWKTIRIKDILADQDLPDELVNTKAYGFLWSADSDGIFYTRYAYRQPGNLTQLSVYQKLYFHRLGTPQSQDILVAESHTSPDLVMGPTITSCRKYLLITASSAYNTTGVYMAKLQDGVERLKDSLVEIIPFKTGEFYEYVINSGSTFIFRTSKGASNYKLVSIDVDMTPAGDPIKLWSTFIEEDPSRVLTQAMAISPDKLLLWYLNDKLRDTLELRSLKDASVLHQFDLGEGTLSEFTCSGDIGDNTVEFFVKMIDYFNPGTIYRCLVSDEASCEVIDQAKIDGIDMSQFMYEYVSFPSTDGTLIPMYIVRKKELKMDGKSPSLLYGYGGFNTNIMPRFSITTLNFIDGFDGVFAQPVLRGGGEFGLNWYDAAAMDRKQASFDDFIAAAEYLIERNYTTARNIAIQGSSNGGLLVAVCINQRPQLYGAAIIQNGLLDLLRQQYFTVGRAWCHHEYGCSDNEAQFKNILKYSPLHNIRQPANDSFHYPAILVNAGDNDDRVVPLHSYKYVAEMQHTIEIDPQVNPVLLRVETGVGHGDGKPLGKVVSEVIDILTFVAEALHVKFMK